MDEHPEPQPPDPPVSPNVLELLRRGLLELLKAWAYADASAQTVWQYAVDLNELQSLGLTKTDLRWLLIAKLAEHRFEVTTEQSGQREFETPADCCFRANSCFVLSECGRRFAQQAVAGQQAPTSEHKQPLQETVAPAAVTGDAEEEQLPAWDPIVRELRVGTTLVKQYRWPAYNQEAILTAFQEEGWSRHIYDPLPPAEDIHPKRRLHDTIKCLNRNQMQRRIRFRGDGTGEGVIWELVPPEDTAE